MEQFTKDLADLLNRHSMENGSGTPDYILASHLTDCLLAWNRAVQEREAWHGRADNASTPQLTVQAE